MSKKNFKVATTENGKTPKQDTKHMFATANIKIDKTPTGKVKTLKDREKIKKEREEQYKNFRIAALKRRAARMGLSEEDTNKKVEELKNQLDTPNSYLVLVLFKPGDKNLVVEALKNEGLAWLMMSNYHFYIEADQETLGTLRGIMPPSAKIYPYVKKKPSVLADVKKKTDKKPTNNKKGVAKFHVKHWKRPNVARLSKKERKEFKNKVKALRASWKAAKPKKATTVHLKPKKSSKSSKKASTNLKKAA